MGSMSRTSDARTVRITLLVVANFEARLDEHASPPLATVSFERCGGASCLLERGVRVEDHVRVAAFTDGESDDAPSADGLNERVSPRSAKLNVSDRTFRRDARGVDGEDDAPFERERRGVFELPNAARLPNGHRDVERQRSTTRFNRSRHTGAGVTSAGVGKRRCALRAQPLLA
jgi:hypothetical protein